MRLAALADIYTYCSTITALLSAISSVVQCHNLEHLSGGFARLYTSLAKCKLKLCSQVKCSIQLSRFIHRRRALLGIPQLLTLRTHLAGAFSTRKHDTDQRLGRYLHRMFCVNNSMAICGLLEKFGAMHLPAAMYQPATTAPGVGDVPLVATGTAVTTGTTAGEGECGGRGEGGAGDGAAAGTVTLVTTGTAVTTGMTAGEGEGGAGTGAGTGTGTCTYRQQCHAQMLACNHGRDTKGRESHGHCSHQQYLQG